MYEANDVLRRATWLHYLPTSLAEGSEKFPLSNEGSNTLQVSAEIGACTRSVKLEDYDYSNSYQTFCIYYRNFMWSIYLERCLKYFNVVFHTSYRSFLFHPQTAHVSVAHVKNWWHLPTYRIIYKFPWNVPDRRSLNIFIHSSKVLATYSKGCRLVCFP
jgi:hypothetical protein